MVPAQVTDDDYRLTIRKFQKVARRMMQGRDRDLEDLGLTSILADALIFFDRTPSSQINDLRDYLDVSHQAACGLVDRMRSKDLLDVRVSEEDARARTIVLSEHGRRVCDDLKARGSDAGHRNLGCLTEDEIVMLSDMLDRITAHMESGDRDGQNRDAEPESH